MYEVISPLGKREGIGTYDTFFDNDKYGNDLEAATAVNDCVVVNFVIELVEMGYGVNDGSISFEAYHTRAIDDKIYSLLGVQHFPAGVDIMDDLEAQRMCRELMEKYNG